jgi:hypothetical protein
MMRKGQAAMEFLMTYGWAILVVLVAIGALAYFGVLSPAKFLPNSCTISPGIGCGEFKATAAAASNVQIYVQNGMGSALSVSALTLTPTSGTCALVTPAALPVTLNDGASQNTVWTCSGIGATSAGARFKGDLAMTYTKTGETLSHSVAGTVVTVVE